MGTASIIKIAVSAFVASFCFIATIALKHKINSNPKNPKKVERFHKISFWTMIISTWYFVVCATNEFTGNGEVTSKSGMFSTAFSVFGLLISKFTVAFWIVIAVVFIFSLLFKFFYLPRFKYIPKGFQNVFEGVTEKINRISEKRGKKIRKFSFVAVILSIWFFIACVVNGITGGSEGINLELELFSARTSLFGLSISDSTITTWKIIAAVFVLSLIFRIFFIPRFKDVPKGLQNVMETAIENIDKFTRGAVGNLSDELSPYMFSIAVLLIGCAAVELFSTRPPTSDLVMTFSLGIITFFLINFYGFKKKGFRGRVKALASPSPVIFPMRVLSDVSVPISLACRLFGNMLGGMVVMDLLKSSLGGYAIGFTSLAGLYFNLFHPLIQTYIFIILSLTFINEAAE